MATTSRRLQGIAVISKDFWELHRRLGECYEADMRRMAGGRGRSPPKGLPVRSLKARGMESTAISEISNPNRRSFTETETFGESVSMTRFKCSRQPSDGALARPERVPSVPLPEDASPQLVTVTEPLPDCLPRPDAVRSGNLSLGSPSETSPMAKHAAKLFRNNFLSLQEEQVMQTIANKAMTIVETAEDDVIFCHGNMASATYFALDESCSMLYLRLTGSTTLKPKGREWITEMCLWTEWLHLGDLITSSFSKFIAIKSQEFCAIVSKSGPCQVQAHHYALEYVEAMNEAEDVSDLWQKPAKEMSPPPPISDMENIFGWSGGLSKVLPSP